MRPPCQLPAILQLLACCALRHCMAFHYATEPLSDIAKSFSASRKDFAFLLPLELRLRLTNSTWSDYNNPVNLLTDLLTQRRQFVQENFHKILAPRGFMLSDSRRFRMENNSLILYYYIAYIGSSHLDTLRTNIRRICNITVTRNSLLKEEKCQELNSFHVALLYNLLLLSTFRFFPQDAGPLNNIFTDFKSLGSTLVTAHNSEAHDITSLLCKVFLRCAPTLCNVSKISVPQSVKTWPEWKMIDIYLKITDLAIEEENVSATTRTLVGNLSADLLLDAAYKDSQEDFGVYRSWCMKLANSIGPHSLMTLIATASALLLLACH